MTLEDFNRLSQPDAEAELLRCCGSRSWARAIGWARPYETMGDLLTAADQIWRSLPHEDWLEAFRHHPRIGERANLKAWNEQEQSGVRGAAEEVLMALQAGNEEYEKKFGHVFLLCATGRTAEDMLALLNERLGNTEDKELRIAASEQGKITKLRLERLMR